MVRPLGRAAPVETPLPFAIFVIAVLYASVGQAGATGYLAAMGLLGIDPAVMKPTALALNIVVASTGTFQFWRAGLFSWRTFYPFGVLGFPFSLLGGALHLPRALYYPVVGAILIAAAAQMARATVQRAGRPPTPPSDPPFFPALLAGAAIGLVSGVTGTGGGVFLAPLILLMNWSDVRRAAQIAAAYNLLNSAAALAGAWATLPALPSALPVWMAVAAVGAILGAWIGSRFLPETAMRLVLSALLAASGVKLLLF